MLFPTPIFACFFTLVFALSWALNHRNQFRKIMLLAASYIFYGWWNWRLCFLLLAASLIAWSAGRFISAAQEESTQNRIAALGITALLAVLGFFKYYDFFISSLQDVLFSLGWERDLPFLEIILPVGISFFTFQAISYIVDVRRKEVPAHQNPLDVLLYISFFPQLVAGPIVRAAHFLPQLQQSSTLTRKMVISGLCLCLVGLFKKLVIANYLATDLVDPVFLDPSSYSSTMLMLGVYGYAVQIYCDFSGYSDMAIGTALLLGFQFNRNFNHPYKALTLQDFWRRWHMSLSQWLRDYLYKPLGGSRFGTLLTYRNLLLTMLLGGLWHGAAWNFVLWGLIHGVWLALERLTGRNEAPQSSTLKLISWAVTFHIVCTAWVLFRAPDMTIAFDWFSGVAAMTHGTEGFTWFTLALVFVPLLAQFRTRDLSETLGSILHPFPFAVTALFFLVGLLATIAIAPSGTPPFIYFQF